MLSKIIMNNNMLISSLSYSKTVIAKNKKEKKHEQSFAGKIEEYLGFFTLDIHESTKNTKVSQT